MSQSCLYFQNPVSPITGLGAGGLGGFNHVFHLPIGEYKGIHGAVDYMVFFMFLGGGRPKLETAILVGVDRRNIKYFLL